MLNSVSLYTIIIFLTLCFVLSIYYSKGKSTLSEYFLAKNNFSWFVLGFVAFITNTSSSSFISITASTYQQGLAVFNFELTGIICCVVLALVFGKIYIRNSIFTTSEYVRMRFNPMTGYITSGLLIFMYILSRISVVIICASAVVEYFFGFDIYTTSILITIFCGVYSIAGGQRTIIKTGFSIGWVVLLGGCTLTYFVATSYQPGVVEKSDTFYHLIHPVTTNSFTWPGVLIALPVIGIWYHCINQELVQKFLGSRNAEEFQAASLLHGYLKLLVFPLIILPGLYAVQLCNNAVGTELYGMLIESYVPESFKGLVVSAIVGAAMVALSASFNACSTIFTFDFYRRIYPNANEFVLMNIGKIATIVIVIISMIWVVLLKTFHHDIYLFVTSVLTYFTPPFAVIYLGGALWKRATGKAALWTLISGIGIGFGKFIITFLHQGQMISSSLMTGIAEYNFMHFTCWLFLVNIITFIAISLLDKAPNEATIQPLLLRYNLPEKTRFQKRIHLASIFLLLIILIIYIQYA